MKGQNSVIVNLPTALARDDELTLTVAYAGRLGTATPEREVIAVQEGQEVLRRRDHPARAAHPLHQPQLLVSAVDGHRLRDRDDAPTVPEIRRASRAAPGNGIPAIVAAKDRAAAPRYVFRGAPARYLAFILRRLTHSAETKTMRLSQEWR